MVIAAAKGHVEVVRTLLAARAALARSFVPVNTVSPAGAGVSEAYLSLSSTVNNTLVFGWGVP